MLARHIPTYTPLSPFIIFRNDIHNQLKAIPSWSGTLQDESRYASERWRALAPAVKQMYVGLAHEEKEAHKMAYPDYRFKPTRSRRGAHDGATPAQDPNSSLQSALSRSAAVSTAKVRDLNDAARQLVMNEQPAEEYSTSHAMYPPLLDVKVETPSSNNAPPSEKDRLFRSFENYTPPNLEFRGSGAL